MNTEGIKVCFVHQKRVSFVEKDLRVLQEAYQVREIEFRGLQDIFKLWQAVRWCEITFCWFGKLHAFFAVLFSKTLGKKSIVVAGGDDVAYEPEINYGIRGVMYPRIYCEE